MNITFKNITKACFAAVLASVAFTSCEDWNQTESVKFEYTTLEQKNPELYQDYLASLRAYRNTDHAVMIAKYDNVSEKPVGRAQHIDAIPDSVDYVILMNADNLTETVVAEMAEVKANKGTRYLYQIDYKALNTEYKRYLEEWNDAHPADETESSTPAEQAEDLATFLGKKVDELLKIWDKYAYDGISVVYEGTDPKSCSEEELKELTAIQTAFFTPIMEWAGKHEDALFFFEGTPQFLNIETTLLERADYFLIPAVTVQYKQGFDNLVKASLEKKNIPADRFVVIVTTISLVDPTIPEGHFSGLDEFGNQKTAIEGAAEWAVGPSTDYVKCGICVNNAQNDYFNLTKDYQHIRKAIAIMNPSY